MIRPVARNDVQQERFELESLELGFCSRPGSGSDEQVDVCGDMVVAFGEEPQPQQWALENDVGNCRVTECGDDLPVVARTTSSAAALRRGSDIEPPA